MFFHMLIFFSNDFWPCGHELNSSRSHCSSVHQCLCNMARTQTHNMPSATCNITDTHKPHKMNIFTLFTYWIFNCTLLSHPHFMGLFEFSF